MQIRHISAYSATVIKNRAAGLRLPCRSVLFLKLLSYNSLLRTYTCAGTALDAEIRVDRINIALADSADRAFSLTSAASDAFVFQNFVSHILRF